MESDFMDYLCIDVGGTNLKYAVINDDFKILEQYVEKTLWNCREDFLDQLQRIYNNSCFKLSGIAISYCGEVSSKNGIIKNGGSYQFNNGLHLKDELEQRCDTKVSVLSDSRCAAIAEMKMGNLKEFHNALVLVIGTGVGCGIILDRKIYEGVHSYAGAVSFAQADIMRQLNWSNVVGNKCGVNALLKRYEEKNDLERSSINGITFFEKINEEDEVAAEVLKDYARALAAYIYSLQAVLDVEAVAIGGGISSQPKLKEYLDQALEEQFKTLPILLYKPELRVCKYHNEANLIGALRNHFEQYEQKKE
jgi:predicted NBD/HSP70 family sugar kinase